MGNINWDDFKSQYWSPCRDAEYDVVLAFWQQEMRSYDDGKSEKACLVFDVLRIDGQELPQGEKQFVTSAKSFAEAVRPLIETAEKNGKEAIAIRVKYGKDKRYSLMNLSPTKESTKQKSTAEDLL